MSHIVVLKLEIKDIEAVKRMCTNLGWEFCENQKTHTYYVGQQNSCDHAIKVPGCAYELGLQFAGDQYQLSWDSYENNLRKAMGGSEGQTFLQEYGLACVTLEAERNGYGWSSTKLDNGNYEVEIETY